MWVFYSSDGYSTGLPLDYLSANKILLAYGINDVTLPPERVFHSNWSPRAGMATSGANG